MNGNRKPLIVDPGATAGINSAARCPAPGPRPPFSSPQSPAPSPQRRGFTLVELLVVITIIGILAGLITAAALRVTKLAKSTTMKMEVTNMAQALDAFKEKFGTYPPDGTNQAAIQQFLAIAFPRYQFNPSSITVPWTPPNCSVALSPSNALSFWLGGLQYSSSPPTGFAANQPAGLSANPTNPFDANASRMGPFFPFDTSRLTSGSAGTTGYVYFPNNGLSSGTSNNSPFVYFCSPAAATPPQLPAPSLTCSTATWRHTAPWAGRM